MFKHVFNPDPVYLGGLEFILLFKSLILDNLKKYDKEVISDNITLENSVVDKKTRNRNYYTIASSEFRTIDKNINNILDKLPKNTLDNYITNTMDNINKIFQEYKYD